MISLLQASALPNRTTEISPLALFRNVQGNFPVHCSFSIGGCTTKISEYAAEQGIAEEKDLANGMEDKTRQLIEMGAEIYPNA